MRSLIVQMQTPECRGHTSSLMAFCSFLSEGSSLIVTFSMVSCVDAMLLHERWVHQIHFHYNSPRMASVCGVGTLFSDWKHLQFIFHGVVSYFLTLTHALESTAQSAFFLSPCDFHISCHQAAFSPFSGIHWARGCSVYSQEVQLPPPLHLAVGAGGYKIPLSGVIILEMWHDLSKCVSFSLTTINNENMT